MKLDTVRTEFAEAIELYLSGNWSDSKDAFAGLTESFTDSSFLHLLLGDICYFLGDLDAATGAYKRAAEIDPASVITQYRMGECYFRAGRLTEARECFNRVLGFDGQSHAMAAHFLGLINQFMGDDDAAIEAFALLRRESSQSLIADFYLAQLKIKHDQAGEARDLLQELVEHIPDFAAGHYLLGIAHCRLHDLTQAVQCFRRVLELRPQDQQARRWLHQITDVEWP